MTTVKQLTPKKRVAVTARGIYDFKLPITNHRQRNDMGAEREGISQNQRGTSELAFKGCPTSDTASSARGRRDGDSDELEDMLEDEHDIWTEMGGGGPPPQYE